MLRGLYTAASGMLATIISTDTMANNLANVGTTGFKGNKVNFQGFREMLITRMSAQGNQVMGALSTGNQVRESVINFAPGAIRQTGNPLDMAIEGDGFFMVKTRGGQIYYTRAGNFTIDDEGFLTTQNGDYVQGTLGNIQLRMDQPPYRVSTGGEIQGAGRVIDRLVISRFADKNTLQKVGDNYYQAGPASQLLDEPPPGVPPNFQVHQYTLEQSNVNPISELVNNIQGMRLYEALQKNIHLSNETLGKAVNEIAARR